MEGEVNQMLKDKLFLVILVLDLLTIMAVAGVITVQRGKGTEINSYLEMPQSEMVAQETAPETPQVVGASEAVKGTQRVTPAPTQIAVTKNENQDNDLVAEAETRKDAVDALVLDFTSASKM